MPQAIEYQADTIIYRQIRLCEGQDYVIPLDFSEYAVYWYAVRQEAIPSPPWTTFFSPDGSVRSFTFSGVTLPDGVDSQDYEVDLAVYEDIPVGSQLNIFRIIVTVARDCRPTYNTCGACGGVNIMWVNQKGGIQNYYFTGVRTFDVSQENAKKYIDPGKVNRYSTRGQVYKGEIVTTKAIPQAHIDLLDSLKYSIQAWVNIDDVLKPIVIDADSYTKYKSRDKKFDLSMKFIYADPINIQKQ